MSEGYLNASRWFKNAENIWDINKTDKSAKMTTNGRLDFQRGLSAQNLNYPYLVLYSTSGKDAKAILLNRRNFNLEFIVDHKTYWCCAESENEANYLTGVLNSSIPNKLMKDFQSKGLFGARDVSKKILDIFSQD